TRKAIFGDIIARPARGLSDEQSRRRAFAAGLIMGDQQARIPKLVAGARKAHSRFDEARPFWKSPQRPVHAQPSSTDSERDLVRADGVQPSIEADQRNSSKRDWKTNPERLE